MHKERVDFMSIVDDVLDPDYRSRAKKKIKELEQIVEDYKRQYKTYETIIDEINEAKVISLKTINEVKEFINSIANKPKELDGVIVTPNIEQSDYEKDIKKENKKYKKGVNGSYFAGAMGIVSVLFLPAALLSVPAMIISGKNEKKNNLSVIEDCNKKLEQIELEMKRLQKSSTETVTEQEFLIVYSNNVRESMLKLKKTGITDYLKFSIEQKSDLGALVNSTNTLIRRIDNR